MTFNQMRAAAEAILFAAGEPVEISRIAQALNIETEDAVMVLQSCAEQLKGISFARVRSMLSK